MAGRPPCSGSAPSPRRSLRPLSGASPHAHPVANPMATRQVAYAKGYPPAEHRHGMVPVWHDIRTTQGSVTCAPLACSSVEFANQAAL